MVQDANSPSSQLEPPTPNPTKGNEAGAGKTRPGSGTLLGRFGGVKLKREACVTGFGLGRGIAVAVGVGERCVGEEA